MGEVTRRQWHLTPSGWVEGELEQYDDGGSYRRHEPRPVPADRVLTYELNEYQEMPSAPVDSGGGPIWQAPDAARVAELQARFGETPFAQPKPRTDLH